jgi:hypothetical protein
MILTLISIVRTHLNRNKHQQDAFDDFFEKGIIVITHLIDNKKKEENNAETTEYMNECVDTLKSEIQPKDCENVLDKEE